jgi:hypothetical protein
MPLNAAGLDDGGEGIAAGIAAAMLYTAAPNAAGSNGIAGVARVAIDLNSTDGNLTLAAPIQFTGGPAGAAVNFLGFFSALSGGVFKGYAQRASGDAALNAAGEYTVNSVSIPATAS